MEAVQGALGHTFRSKDLLLQAVRPYGEACPPSCEVPDCSHHTSATLQWFGNLLLRSALSACLLDMGLDANTSSRLNDLASRLSSLQLPSLPALNTRHVLCALYLDLPEESRDPQPCKSTSSLCGASRHCNGCPRLMSCPASASSGSQRSLST